MTPIPLNDETQAIARRVVWFEEPREALEDPIRFMAYAMKGATREDMKALRRYISDGDFREALDKAPPGTIDPRSWAYWNSVMGRYPAPPMPTHFRLIKLAEFKIYGTRRKPNRDRRFPQGFILKSYSPCRFERCCKGQVCYKTWYGRRTFRAEIQQPRRDEGRRVSILAKPART